jgi:hypothetical protein
LVGHGPSGKLVRSNTDNKHTIFLFDDQSLPFVMDAYANYLAEVFDADELRDGIFTAVGAVHKTGEDTQRPRNVGHYWPDYDHELTSSDPKPQTLYQYVGVARKRAREFGDAHDAVQKIAEAVLRLARLANQLDVPASRGRCHLQILELLKDNADNQTLYREFQTRVAINNAVPEIGEWKSKWVPTLRSIAESISGGAWTSAADAFLRYSDAQRFRCKNGVEDSENSRILPSRLALAEDRTPSVALRLVLPDHLADVRLVDTVGLVALAGRARTADASQLRVPRLLGMILADPADASADRAIWVHAFDRPLKELARSRPSAVISRYSTSATNFGSTQVVLGALIGFVNFDLELTTVSSCFRIRLETVRDQPFGADLADVDQFQTDLLSEVKCRDPRRTLHESHNRIPVRVRFVTLPLSRWICRRWPSYLISWSQLSPAGGFDLREAS